MNAILETANSIVQAAKSLDAVLFFLVLICVLGLLGVILQSRRKNVQALRLFFGLLITAVAVAGAFMTHKTSKQLEAGLPRTNEKTADARLFLPLGQSRPMDSFRITLIDVDTLKTKIVPGETPPWIFNRKFGEALADFSARGRIRLQNEFFASTEALSRWLTPEDFNGLEEDEASAQRWQRLLERLDITVKNKTTERAVSLKECLSKWPVIRLRIQRADDDAIVFERYVPDRAEIALPDSKSRLKIEAVFNGDRDLGEAEACELSLSSD